MFSIERPIKHLQQKIISEDGDCLRTCLAMLLGAKDPEEVPFFPEGSWPEYEEWLGEEGYDLIHIPSNGLPAPLFFSRLQHQLNGGAAVIVTGLVDTLQWCHCVVVTADNIFDPGYEEGHEHCIAYPNYSGEYWVTILLPIREEQS